MKFVNDWICSCLPTPNPAPQFTGDHVEVRLCHIIGVSTLGFPAVALETNMGHYISLAFTLLMLWLLVGAWRLRKRGVSVGPAAAGMMNEILSKDQRAAVQIIMEERAAARDPENREGDLPNHLR
jgi:hypothetical protein